MSNFKFIQRVFEVLEVDAQVTSSMFSLFISIDCQMRVGCFLIFFLNIEEGT